MIADGTPADVLNRYQKIIMEREEAYKAESGSRKEEAPFDDLSLLPLNYSYRHGDGSAEIMGAELLDSAHRRVEIVESGESLTLRIIARLNTSLDDPVVGFSESRIVMAFIHTERTPKNSSLNLAPFSVAEYLKLFLLSIVGWGLINIPSRWQFTAPKDNLMTGWMERFSFVSRA